MVDRWKIITGKNGCCKWLAEIASEWSLEWEDWRLSLNRLILFDCVDSF